MRIDPYLIFDGQCEAAFKFYQQCLGGTLQAMMRFADAPVGGGDQPGLRVCPHDQPVGVIARFCIAYQDAVGDQFLEVFG